MALSSGLIYICTRVYMCAHVDTQYMYTYKHKRHCSAMVHWYVLRVLAQPFSFRLRRQRIHLAAPVCSIFLIVFVQWNLDSDKYKYFYLIALWIKAELLCGHTYTCRHIHVIYVYMCRLNMGCVTRKEKCLEYSWSD